MSTEFDSLTSVSDWSTKLTELLSAARAAAEQSDDARLSVARRLTDFIAHSFPASPEILRLDEIASAAARSLSEQVSADATDRIASRSALLELLAGELLAVRSRTNLERPPSDAVLSDLAGDLAALAADARDLVALRRQGAQGPERVHARFSRLAESLADLHASIRGLVGKTGEPPSRSSGTVLPSETRDEP